MPELPEVETVVRQLERKIKGRRINGFTVNDYRLNGLKRATLCGKKISGVRREGKQVCIEFAAKGGYLLIHLRMTGRLIWVPKRANSTAAVDIFLTKFKIADAHVRVRFELTGGTLLFVDPRRFGTIQYFAKLPKFRYIDPLSKEFDVARLAALAKNRRQNLKQFLLRQDLIVGIGNIYASEILFRAKLNPWKEAAKLQADDNKRLHREIRSVLLAAIKANGTTFSDFQDTEGSSGGYSKRLKVYGRDNELCANCKTTVIGRKVQGGRSTYYCITCQPGGGRNATR